MRTSEDRLLCLGGGGRTEISQEAATPFTFTFFDWLLPICRREFGISVGVGLVSLPRSAEWFIITPLS